MTHLASIFQDLTIDTDLKAIAQKVIDKSRITPEEALVLYEKGDIAYLGALANHIREERYGDQTFLIEIFILSLPMCVSLVVLLRVFQIV